MQLQLTTKQLLAIAGALVLFVGAFMPIVSLPVVGNMNYFQNGAGDGVIIVLFAGVTVLAVWLKRYALLWVTGVGSLLLLAYTFVRIQSALGTMRSDMEKNLAGNPFRGIGEAMMQSVQLQWGWAVLVIGAGLVIASAAIKDDGAESGDAYFKVPDEFRDRPKPPQWPPPN